jgi:peptidoglycan DL-endopeptidase CwlO
VYGLTRRHAAFVVLALVVGLLGARSATPAPPAVEQKEAEAQTVLAQIQEMDADLEKVIEAYNAAQIRLDAIEAEQRENERLLEIAKTNYGEAHAALASRLVALYQGDGDVSVLEVMLGSESLPDLLDRLDAINRVSDQDIRIVDEITAYKVEIKERERKLAQAQAEQEQVVAERAAHKQEIEAQLAERQRLLATIKDQIERIKAEEAARQRRLQAEAERRLAEQQESPSAPVESSGGGGSSSGGSGGAPPAPSHGGVVGIAMQYLGTPYVWGGASPAGFDCSGFVMYVFSKVGVSLPHNAAMQYGYGSPVSRSALAPGDLVFFNGLGHNGIYIGGNQFIHSPHTGDVVKISTITGWYASTWVGARRL